MSFDFEEAENEFDEDIINIFKDSSYDHIDKITSFLFELEFDKSDLNNILVEINRSAHSLKGDSNSLGFSEIGVVAHQMESYIHTIQEDMSLFDENSLSTFFGYMEKIKELLDANFSNSQNETTKKDTVNYAELASFIEKVLELTNAFSQENQNFDSIIALFDTNIDLLKVNYQSEELNAIVERVDFYFNKIKENKAEPDIFSLSNYLVDLNLLLEKTVTYEKKQTYENLEKEETYFNDSKNDDKTIRVSLPRIDALIDYSSELISNFNKYDYKLSELSQIYALLTQIEMDKNYTDLPKVNKMLFNIYNTFKKDNLAFYSIINGLNYDIKKTRMLPAKALLEQMRVVARTSSMKLGKLVKLSLTGQEVELDLFLLEKIKDPLSHLIRNSIDHGIETRETRLTLNKAEEANLELNIFILGSDVVFEIKDDGKGLDYEKIKAKALNIGLINEEKALSITKEELQLIMFMPGFSTSDKVTDISGRGVGLDVVKSTIEALGGIIKITSEENKGTTFTIKVSLRMTNFESLILRLENKVYAMPISYVSSVISVNLKKMLYEDRQQMIMVNGNKIKLIDLSEVLNVTRKNAHLPEEVFVMIVSVRNNQVAFIIDELVEIKEIVMKDFGGQIKKLKNISGVTILGDGTPILVLNPYDLMASFEISFINSNILEKIRLETEIREAVIRKKALVVDDSITTRTLEKNILESSGFEVKVAKDGLEGTEILQSFNPDIVITDCEMPKMNGYEFTRWIRKSQYRDLPVIMVTSLADNEFKIKGMEAGVDSYIVKGEFNQETFLDTIDTLLI